MKWLPGSDNPAAAGSSRDVPAMGRNIFVSANGAEADHSPIREIQDDPGNKVHDCQWLCTHTTLKGVAESRVPSDPYWALHGQAGVQESLLCHRTGL